MLASDPDFRKQISSLLAADAPALDLARAFAERVAPDEVELFLEEVDELPPSIWLGMANYWLLAEEAGKRFELRSTRPRMPVDAARKRRVEFSVAFEDDAVIVVLSHIPNRHSAWYGPERLSA